MSVAGDELVAGAVLDPVHDERFAAVRGNGAICTDVPLRVTPAPAAEQAVTRTQSADPRIVAFAGEPQRLPVRTGGSLARALLMSHVAAHLTADASAAGTPGTSAWAVPPSKRPAGP